MEDQAWACWRRLLSALEGPVPWGTGRPITGQVRRLVIVYTVLTANLFYRMFVSAGGFSLITTLATAEYRVVLILAWQVCNSVMFL